MQWAPRRERQRGRHQGAALVALGAAVLAAGVWWGVVAGSGDPPGREEGPPAVDVRNGLDLVPGCTIDTCQVLARRAGFRFDGRGGTLAVVGRPGECRGLLASRLHLVTADRVLWSSPSDIACGDPVGGVETDRTGNAFLVFGASRAGDGAGLVVVLRFDGDEVEDFGSFEGRYTGPDPRVRDLDDDGVFEIVLGSGEVWRWDGGEYRRS